MSYRIKDPDTGEFITIANGSRMFVGTTAAIDAAIARGELKYPDLYACTDDYNESTKITVPTLNSAIGVNYSRVFTRSNVATVSVDTHQTTSVIPANTAILSGLPKPLRQIWFMVFADATTWYRGYIDTDGNFKLLNDYPSGGSLRGSVSYAYDEE